MPEDIRDVKPPIDFPTDYLLLILYFSIFILITCLLLYFYFKKKEKITKPIIPTDLRKPWEKAYEELKALKNKNFLSKGQFKFYYSGLSDIVRHYIEDRFSIKAPEMTTEEFFNSIKNFSGLTKLQKDVLKDFLFSSDMVKFAEFKPEVSDAESCFHLAERLINDTKINSESAKNS